MTEKDFGDVPGTNFMTSVSKVELPMFFYSVAVRHLNYFVDYDRVAPKLER